MNFVRVSCSGPNANSAPPPLPLAPVPSVRQFWNSASNTSVSTLALLPRQPAPGLRPLRSVRFDNTIAWPM